MSIQVRLLNVLKDIRHLPRHIFIGGHEHHIGVDTSCTLVHIARTDAGYISMSGRDMDQLAMYLERLRAKEYIDARLDHLLSPGYVALLVKACQQLHDDRHFLTILGSADQRINHGRILCHSILGNLDLIHLRIKGRLHQKADQIIKRLIREMQ